MDEKAMEIKKRVEEEACRICKKDPLTKDDVMLLSQLVDMLKDISTTSTMDEYGDKYLTPEEASWRRSMRRGRSPSTGRFMSMREPYYEDSYNDIDEWSERSFRGGGGGGSSNRGGSSAYRDGYSSHSINDRMIDALERMMDTAATEHERETIRKRIEEIRRDK